MYDSVYYPFMKLSIYCNKRLFSRYGRPEVIFDDTLQQSNKLIVFEKFNNYTMIYDRISSPYFLGVNVPLYTYKNNKKESNISQEAKELFQKQYKDASITEEQIFSYVYAVLNSQEYRTKYKNELENLKAEPRIPFYNNFHALSTLGQQLIELHLNYETLPKDKSTQFVGDLDNEVKDYSSLKKHMESGIDEDTCSITLDEYTKFINIPKEAFLDKNPIFNREPQTQMGFMLYYTNRNIGKDKLQDSKEWKEVHTEQHNLERWNKVIRPYLVDKLPRVITCSIQTYTIKREINKWTKE